jgi:hypothetical protein
MRLDNITVVVPTRNEQKNILAFLNSLSPTILSVSPISKVTTPYSDLNSPWMSLLPITVGLIDAALLQSYPGSLAKPRLGILVPYPVSS